MLTRTDKLYLFGPASLDGLDQFHLRELTIFAYMDLPVNFEPISKLHQLEVLSLSHSGAMSIDFLDGLNHLHSLDLSYTSVSDISLLPALPKLSTLNLMGTLIKDLTPLAGIKTLQWLQIDSDQLKTLPELDQGQVQVNVVPSFPGIRKGIRFDGTR